MTDPLRIVMAQINVLVGDIAGNTRQVIDWCRQARDELGADVVVFPELTLTGYPPEDLLLRPGLHARVETAAGELRQSIRGITAVVGLAHSLRMQVVAEGIETDAQLHFLRRQRCDFGQGLWFSRPLEGEQFAAHLQRRDVPAVGNGG